MTIAAEPTTDASHGKTLRLTPRAQTIVIAALLLVYIAVGWRGRSPLGIGANDEIAYLALSRSVEAGTYRELFQPSAPWHVQYPPAYPAWLVLVRHATGERVDLIPAVNLGLVVVSLLILVGVVRQMVGGWWAVALLLILVLNSGLLWTGGSSASEALFLILSIGALAATHKAESSPEKRWVYAAVALALMAFLTRSVGIALVGAIGVWLLSRRRRNEMVIYGIASATIVGGWFAYTALAPRSALVSTYANDFMSGRATERPSAAMTFANRVWTNAMAYGTGTLPVELSLPAIPGTWIDNVGWLCIDIVCIAAGLVMLWRSWRAAAAYLMLYAAILLVWTWPIGRFLWPVVPLVMLTLLIGARRLAQRLPDRIALFAPLALVVLLAAGAVRGAAEWLARIRDCDRVNPYTSPGCYPAEIRSMASASDYIRRHAAQRDIVLTERASAVAFLSGHLAESARLVIQLPTGGTPTALRARRIRYVLLTSNTEFERGALSRALIDSCAELRVEARFPARTLLLRTSDPGDATADACADLLEFRIESQKAYGNRL